MKKMCCVFNYKLVILLNYVLLSKNEAQPQLCIVHYELCIYQAFASHFGRLL